MSEQIRIDGLAEFSRALRRMDAEAPRQLRNALNDSAQVIVDWARPRIPVRSGRARRSVKAQSTRTLARVVGGSQRVPYYAWLDFGGRVGRKHAVVRPFRKHGRYIYEGYYQNRDRFAAKLDRSLRDVVRSAGIEAT